MKTSIHLSETLTRLREEAQASSQQGFGGVLTTIVDRYTEIVRRHKPNLSEPEWNLIRDCMNASCYWERPESVLMLPISVRAAIELDGLDRKWEVTGPALLTKLAVMDYATLVAVVESVESWWRKQ